MQVASHGDPAFSGGYRSWSLGHGAFTVDFGMVIAGGFATFFQQLRERQRQLLISGQHLLKLIAESGLRILDLPGALATSRAANSTDGIELNLCQRALAVSHTPTPIFPPIISIPFSPAFIRKGNAGVRQLVAAAAKAEMSILSLHKACGLQSRQDATTRKPTTGPRRSGLPSDRDAQRINTGP